MQSHLQHLSLIAVALVCITTGAAVNAQVTAYATDADSVVLRYSFRHGEIAAAESGPSLVIYGDGRARVHYPAYMKRSGDRDVRLTRAEITELLNGLTGAGALDIDTDNLRSEVRQAARETESGITRPDGVQEVGVAEYVSDAPVTIIEMNVIRGQGAAAKPVRKLIRLQNLQHDARRFRKIAALQGFAEAETRLTAIMERD
jgi:hypothetical protein